MTQNSLGGAPEAHCYDHGPNYEKYPGLGCSSDHSETGNSPEKLDNRFAQMKVERILNECLDLAGQLE